MTVNSMFVAAGRDLARASMRNCVSENPKPLFKFSDIPIGTQGIDEARQMATEALAFHLQGMAEDGQAVPEPSSLEEIMTIAENKDGVAVLIDAPEAEVKACAST